MEVSVRSARLTDVDAAVRLITQSMADSGTQREDADRLRHLLFVPAATVVVALAERRLVGVGVLSIRPSVRSGPFIGVVEELGIVGEGEGGSAGQADDTVLRGEAASRLLAQLIASARNKGCSRVEVTDPLASAEPALLEQAGFEQRGALMSRAIGLNG
ncbi:MAG: GNAT family N-acetyltransferase [Chloroflexota bacterium]|nr:GNAT family N-acetyltransferase [Chloroflexota bacterium]